VEFFSIFLVLSHISSMYTAVQRQERLSV
jgi:hypothetical protein